MEVSHRHHYVPQFLIRNFTDERGLLHIYDKDAGKTYHRSTKHAFFAWNRNLVEVEGQELDNLEKLYADLDTHFARDLQEVLRDGITDPEHVTSILLLAATQKWRTPGADARFEELKHNAALHDLSIDIRLKDPKAALNADALRDLVDSDLFKEAKRVLLPALPFLNNEEDFIEMHNHSFIWHYDRAHGTPNLLGDCSIIEQPGSAYNRLGNFVFPLSSWDTFICRRNRPQQVTPLFKVSTDLAVIHFSQRYVGCSDRRYLDLMVGHYQELRKKVGQKMEPFLCQGLF